MLLSFFVALILFSHSWNGYIKNHSSLYDKYNDRIKKKIYWLFFIVILSVGLLVLSLFILKVDEDDPNDKPLYPIFLPIIFIFYLVLFQLFKDYWGTFFICIGIGGIFLVKLLDGL